MKKSLVVVAAVFAAVLSLSFISCKENGKGKKDGKFVESVMMWHGGALWNENAEGKMVYKRSLPQGTVLQAVYDASSETLVETKKCIRISGKEEAEKTFVHVKYDDEYYWAQESLIAVNATAGVVPVAAVTYKSASSEDVNTKLKVSGLQVVAVEKTTYMDEFNTAFSKISWNDGKNTYNNIFVKSDDVVVSKSDVYAVQIMNAIDKSKDEFVKSELRDNLNSLFIHSEEINALKQNY